VTASIELFHLRRVRDKPQAVALLVQHARLTPDAALAVVHQALGGGKPQVRVPGDAGAGEGSDAAALRFIVALADTGFIARRATGAGFDPARHATQVVAAVLPRCPPELAAAVGALLLRDDWAEALALALQHLQRHRAPPDVDRQSLEHAAIDCGLVRGVPGRV